MLLSLLFMPPRDEMLQFIDESGLINVYLLVLSFLVSPVNKEDLQRFEAEIEAIKHQARLYQAQLKRMVKQAESYKSKSPKKKKSQKQKHELTLQTESSSEGVFSHRRQPEHQEVELIELGHHEKEAEEDKEEEKEPDLGMIEVFHSIEDNGMEVRVNP